MCGRVSVVLGRGWLPANGERGACVILLRAGGLETSIVRRTWERRFALCTNPHLRIEMWGTRRPSFRADPRLSLFNEYGHWGSASPRIVHKRQATDSLDTAPRLTT